MARQKSALPTNKLAVGSAVTAVFGTQFSPAVAEVWPQIVPALFAGPAMTEFVAGIAAVAVGIGSGYFIPDAANVPA